VKRLLIATSNPAKLAEYRALLADVSLELVSLRDLGIVQLPEETGASFAENALLKARYYYELSLLPVLADDGGLEIDALRGEPGVRSHRWLDGREASDERLIEEVMRRTRDLPETERTARLRSAMALVFKTGDSLEEHVFEAAIEGVVPARAYPKFRQGFPYRSVLFLPERGCFLAELSEEEETRLSQRRITVERARPVLGRIAS
jgi:XTP/dITP diphosphohydrolase